ncbi:nuclear transport factor 2 family protein [Actinomyces ruminis]|uniref:Nuclear transport factor 2 family protein n=2 Tax=Actinomyces TaxID=1654 RepID=A0ABX4ME82_9ACTO|nr:nuclear transport factor 2 family protein [Actinomyces ruminis]PHP53753.1 nuclear transport factor 2 family protein [Actinomyces ruminis]
MPTELEHKDAIREVIDRFSNLEVDVAEQSKLFTPDAHVVVYNADGSKMMEFDGADQLVELFGAAMAGVNSSFHINGQQVITIDGDTATDVHYGQALLVQEQDGKDVLQSHSIRYIDTLVLRDGDWRISSREQHFVVSETREYLRARIDAVTAEPASRLRGAGSAVASVEGPRIGVLHFRKARLPSAVPIRGSVHKGVGELWKTSDRRD